MKMMLLGGAGFIGTNLAKALALGNSITIVDKNEDYFANIKSLELPDITYTVSELLPETDYEELVEGQELVYHLASTTVPTTSNQHISQELNANVVMSSNLLEACVHQGVKKVVFFSSGGTVYGKEVGCPLAEATPTNPISSYGIQKVTIEKLLYLYQYLYGLDYRIIRLSNPYGPYQRPNGILGAVTTFTYKALKREEIEVYGDGSVVRDFIFIEDAIRGVLNIVNGKTSHRTFNLGSGQGTSINDVLKTVSVTLGIKLNVRYREGRKVDVPVNYLDISRYESAYGNLSPISLAEGIWRTAQFMRENYII